MAPFDFDPFDETFRRDPYAAYARGRREHPVFAHPNFPVVSLFRYQDTQALLRDPSQWSNFFPLPPGMERPDDMPPSMLGVDPPEHTRLRGLVSQAFTPRVIRLLEPRLHAIAHELLDAALAERTVDLVATLTHPLPVIVIAEMLGIPARDRAQFKVWSDALVKNLGMGLLTAPTIERLDEQRTVIREMRTSFLPLVPQRPRGGGAPRRAGRGPAERPRGGGVGGLAALVRRDDPDAHPALGCGERDHDQPDRKRRPRAAGAPRGPGRAARRSVADARRHRGG